MDKRTTALFALGLILLVIGEAGRPWLAVAGELMMWGAAGWAIWRNME